MWKSVFPLIDENRFRHNESGSLGGEDCGLTQHILLLDEFYRTAVRLAGKRILWIWCRATKKSITTTM
ncbi:hypothetical protein ACLBR5_02245 [Escherichia coli]